MGKRSWFLILPVSLVSFLALAFSPSGALAQRKEAAATRIRIAYPAPSLSYLPVRVALEKGFFKKRGMEAQFVQMVPPVAVPALLSREVDYATVIVPGSTAAARGAPMKVICLTAANLQHTLVARPEIRSIADLAGKKIGVSRLGDITDYEVRVLIEKYKLGPSTVVLPIGADRVPAVLSGAVEATVVPVPTDIKAEELGLKRLLEMRQILQIPTSGLVATEDKMKRQRGEVLEVLKGIIEGLEYTRSHKEDVASLIARWIKLKPAEARKALDSVMDTYSPYCVPTGEQVQSYVAMLRETAGIREDVPTSAIFDFSLAEEAAKQLGAKK